MYWIEITLSWELFVIIVKGGNLLWKPNFCFKRKLHCNENSLLYIYIYLFFTRNDLVTKIFRILRLTLLYIYLSVVAPIVLPVRIFDACVIAHGLWIGFTYLSICIFFIKDKTTSLCKNSLTWSCRVLYLLYRIKRHQSRKLMLFIWYVNRNNTVVKIAILIHVWCLTCWPQSTNVWNLRFSFFWPVKCA